MLELKIGPGRRNSDIIARTVRPIEDADLVLLAGERGTQPIPIKALRDRHHRIARLVAEGMRNYEVAAIVGMTESRISILKTDPTFLELVEFYRQTVNAAYADTHEHLAGLTLDATLILRERLEESPETFTNAGLESLVKLGADRTGLGPTTKTEMNVNVNLASRLEAARKRVAERRMIEIDGEVVRPSYTSEVSR